MTSFTIDGPPAPKGSLKCFGRGRHVEDNPRSKAWLALAANTAAEFGLLFPEGTPVGVDATFYVQRPKSLPKRVLWSVRIGPGDADKLARNLLDALTAAGTWRDDSQVVDLHVRRLFGEPRTEVNLWRVDQDCPPACMDRDCHKRAVA